MRGSVVLVVMFLFALGACSEPAVPPGYDVPESVLYDAQDDVYLVSNILGEPAAKDGNGYIARVQPDLSAMDRYWIRGGEGGVVLNAPKGMALHQNVLWVADIDVLRKFDRVTGAPLGEVAIPGASFLNDCAVGNDGTVYCTDTGVDAKFEPTGTDAVWRIGEDGVPEALAKGPELGQPNGIVVRDRGVFVVTWRDGTLYQIDFEGRRTVLGKAPTGALDGLVRVEGDRPVWFVTSWEGKCVYRFTPTGGFEPLPVRLDQPADAGWDSKRSLLLVPLFGSDRIERLGTGPR